MNQLHRVPITAPSSPGATSTRTATDDGTAADTTAGSTAPGAATSIFRDQSQRLRQFEPSEHAKALQRVIRQLGTFSDAALSPKRLVSLLQEAGITATAVTATTTTAAADAAEHRHYERELEWLLLSKAAIQAYGIVLNSLVSQTLPLSQDLFYWDEVLSSYRYTAVYWLQTSPHRLIQLTSEIFLESRNRLRELREMERPQFLRLPNSQENVLARARPSHRGSREEREEEDGDGRVGVGMVEEEEGGRERERERRGPSSESLSETARKLYGLVRNTVHDRVILHRLTAMSPFSLARHEIRQKQAGIRKLREMQASALGVLIGEGLSFVFDDDHDEWRGLVEHAVLLMENVVRNVSLGEGLSLDEFEETVFVFDRAQDERPAGLNISSLDTAMHIEAPTARGAYADANADAGPTAVLSARLQAILRHHLPAQTSAARDLAQLHGRPGRLTRYWLPAAALVLSSSTVLRILVNRREELSTWVRELGATTVDFWVNWVVEPTRKVIGTIRHSEDSEVALVGRKSLAADMESLERMVVDFAVDNPGSTDTSTSTTSATRGAPLTAREIEVLRQNVKEGDLTPVLRAYEHDLRRPFRGAARGELVRALLIQIQKTKVDVEVAISGIDRLLKSQELVFGFVGLTPGLLISVVAARWFAGLFQGRQRKSGRVGGQMVRRLRNVDRILTASAAVRGQNQGCLNYKEHGLLLCEVHVLREDARRVLNSALWAEFVADLDELVDVRGGVAKQMKIVERIRW